MLAVTVLLVTLSVINFGDAFVCPPCDKKLCKEVSCELGQEPRPSTRTCGCCDTCFTILKEDAACGQSSFLLPSPSTADCAKGLICYEGKCQNEKKVINKLVQSQKENQKESN